MKERYQNPVVGDTVRLRLFSYNSNNRASVSSIEKIDIYFQDPHGEPALIKTIQSSDITEETVGLYSALVDIEENVFPIGSYKDIWTLTVGTETVEVANDFQIYPSLWFTTPIPIIYDFNFSFRPNRLAKGSKRYLAVEVVPNVPSRDEAHAYYENLAITSPIKISIEKACGPCDDNELIVEQETVELREKCMAYYFLDTTDLDVGMYNVWFEIELGENLYISDKQQLVIF